MTDLQDRLVRLAPEVDSEAALAGLHDRSRRHGRRRRTVVAGVAVVTVLAAVGAAVVLDRADLGRDEPATDPERTPGQWRALADPPFGQAFVEEGRVWTGDEVIVLGHREGSGVVETSWGAAYDPESDAWRAIARSPLVARSDPVVVWTGEEVLVWGGDPQPFEPYEDHGAAYDPDTDTWRRIALAPIESGGAAHGAWVDGELVVVGGRRVDGPPTGCVADPCLPSGRYLREGAAYDPASDTWRRIADLPVVVGQYAETTAADGELRIFNPLRSLAYDVAEDEWRELSLRTTEGGELPTLVAMHAAGGTAIAVDDSFVPGDPSTMADIVVYLYRPERDRWERAPDVTDRESPATRCTTSVTPLDGRLLLAGCAFAEVDVATGEWTPIDPPAADGVGRADLFLLSAGEGVGGDGVAYLSITGFASTTGPIRPDDREDVPGFVAYQLAES